MIPADPTGAPGELTRALAALRARHPDALDRLVPLLYQDLRRLAHQRLRRERDGHTLDTTALAHEAYLRLASQHALPATDRHSFLAAVSNTMRRVLVDYARTRRRVKRGDGHSPVPLDDEVPMMSDRAVEETLALDVALDRLAALMPRAAQVFEQRLFGGLTNDEVADALGVSPKTAQRDWDAARAWLRKEVGRDLASARG